jgi:uncharacterized membrane protein
VYPMEFLFLFFSGPLGCLGLCLNKLLTCLLVGGLLVALGVLLCRRRCFLVFCCVFVRKEIIEVLRTTRKRWRSLSLFSPILFIFGQLQLYLLLSLVFMIFLLFFLLLVRCFSCILSMYLGMLYTFNNILIT